MNSRSRRRSRGFSLMELLVVVTIIGILAAIAIPAFARQREKADDGVAKSLVRAGQSAMEVYFAESQTYVGANAIALRPQEPNIAWVDGTVAQTARNEVGVSGVAADTYVLVTTSRTGVTYAIRRSADGALHRCKVTTTCTTNEW